MAEFRVDCLLRSAVEAPALQSLAGLHTLAGAGAQCTLHPHPPTHPPMCRDVVTDTVHQFAPAYHDYVLYSDGTRKAVTPPKTVRTRTFVAGWSSWDGCGPS